MNRSFAFSAGILVILTHSALSPAGVLLTAQKVELIDPLAGFTAWELGLETDDGSLLQAFDVTLSGPFHQNWLDMDFDSIADPTGRGMVDGRVDSHLIVPGNALIVREPTEDNAGGIASDGPAIRGLGSYLSGVWGIPGSSQTSAVSLAYLVMPSSIWDVSLNLDVATSAGVVTFQPNTILSHPDPLNLGKTVLARAEPVLPPPVLPSVPPVIIPDPPGWVSEGQIVPAPVRPEPATPEPSPPGAPSSSPGHVALTAQRVELIDGSLSGYTAWALGLQTDDGSLLRAFDVTLSGGFQQKWIDQDFDSVPDPTGRGQVDGRGDSHLVVPDNALVVRDPMEDNAAAVAGTDPLADGLGSYLSGVWGIPGSRQADSTTLAYVLMPTDGWDLSVDLAIATSGGVVNFTPDTTLASPDPLDWGQQILAAAAVIPSAAPSQSVVSDPPVLPMPPTEPNLPPSEDFPSEQDPAPSEAILDDPGESSPEIPSDGPDGSIDPGEVVEIPIEIPTALPVEFPWILRNGDLEWPNNKAVIWIGRPGSMIEAVLLDGAVDSPVVLTLAGMRQTSLLVNNLMGLAESDTLSVGNALLRNFAGESDLTVPEPNSLVVATLILLSSISFARQRIQVRA